MTMMMSLMFSFLASSLAKSVNPVKSSVSILMLSVLMFFWTSKETGVTWMPILMLMLFMGGIIMMFMMLSSILPNEKMKKSKSLIFMLMFLLIFMNVSEWTVNSELVSLQSKSFLQTGLNFMIMMILILKYFSMSMSVISVESNPMRNISCCYMFNFVN